MSTIIEGVVKFLFRPLFSNFAASFLGLYCLCTSCQAHKTWQIDRLHGCRSCDSAARLSAYATTKGPKFQLEWLINTSGEHLFVSAYSLDFPESGQIQIQAGDNEQTFFGYVYMGGQKLWLPPEARDFVRDALMEGTPLILSIGCYSGVIEADGFAEKYERLKEVPYLHMDCCPPRGMM